MLRCWPKSRTTLQRARQEIAEVEQLLQEDLREQSERLGVAQRQLRMLVAQRAPKASLQAATRQILVTNRRATVTPCQQAQQRDLLDTEKRIGNAARERKQLADVQNNTQMVTALKRSAEAQQYARQKEYGDIDDMLDDIEENRGDTKELSARLAGGDDEHDLVDQDDLDMDAVLAAMGEKVQHSDDVLARDVARCLGVLPRSGDGEHVAAAEPLIMPTPPSATNLAHMH